MRRNPPSGSAIGGVCGPGVGPPLRTLVVGYGSPIRGDDAIGPLAAEALAATPLPEGVRVEARHVLTAELAEEFAAEIAAGKGTWSGIMRKANIKAE